MAAHALWRQMSRKEMDQILPAAAAGKEIAEILPAVAPEKEMPQILPAAAASKETAQILPVAAAAFKASTDWSEVYMREWEEPEWRQRNGWQGSDLCHKPDGRGVVVIKYFHNRQTRELVGFVRFGPECESHRGLCHGGAMCSLLDDVCGHCCFVDSDAPWSGATVQVNCKLKKPVAVGSVLQVVGRVDKREGRKVFISAVLRDCDGEGDAVYATMDGLSIAGVKMGDNDDAVSRRKWTPQDGILRDIDVIC